MPDIIDRFKAEYQEYHHISPSRSIDQIKELRRVEGFIAPKSILELSAEDLQSYLAHRGAATNLAPNSVRKARMLILAFFTWAFQAEQITGDQLLRLRTVRDPKGATSVSTPKPYSAKELKQFWRELDDTFPLVRKTMWQQWEYGNAKYWRIAPEVRRRQIEAIVALALHCGLRMTEIYNLSMSDLHPDNAYVVVRQRAKTPNAKDRFREVPYTNEARAIVKRWLDMRIKIGVKHKKPWIKAWASKDEVRRGTESWLKPMPERQFQQLLTYVGRRYRREAGKKGCWRFHRFRHTSATNWLRAGMNIEVVSQHLGHSNISQTLGYAELVREDLQRAVENYEAKFERLIHAPDLEEEET